MDMEGLLREAIERGASDVHVVPGLSPIVRISTELIPTTRPAVTDEEARAMVREMVGTRRFALFIGWFVIALVAVYVLWWGVWLIAHREAL